MSRPKPYFASFAFSVCIASPIFEKQFMAILAKLAIGVALNKAGYPVVLLAQVHSRYGMAPHSCGQKTYLFHAFLSPRHVKLRSTLPVASGAQTPILIEIFLA